MAKRTWTARLSLNASRYYDVKQIGDYDVEMTIDIDALMGTLAKRAVRNVSGRATQAGGLVVLRAHAARVIEKEKAHAQ